MKRWIVTVFIAMAVLIAVANMLAVRSKSAGHGTKDCTCEYCTTKDSTMNARTDRKSN